MANHAVRLFGSELAEREPATPCDDLLREITSDLICASGLGKLGRVKFAQVFKSDRADLYLKDDANRREA